MQFKAIAVIALSLFAASAEAGFTKEFRKGHGRVHQVQRHRHSSHRHRHHGHHGHRNATSAVIPSANCTQSVSSVPLPADPTSDSIPTASAGSERNASAPHSRRPRPTTSASQAPPSSQPARPTTSSSKPTSSAAPAPSPSASSSGGAAAGSAPSSDFAKNMLKSHNDFRAKYGAAALVWDDDMAAKAQTWSDKCVFKHSGGSLGPFGENIAAGYADEIAAVKGWTDEAPEYDPSNPQASHFTQVVWKDTTKLGCAVTQCKSLDVFNGNAAPFYVCEYNPAGNVFPAENFGKNVGTLQG